MKKSLAAIASALAVTCACTAFAATPAPSADPAVVAATRQMMESMKMRDVVLASMRAMDQQMPARLAATMNAMIDGDATLSADKRAQARKKLESQRKYQEGSADWDVMYRKYYEEEAAKHRKVMP